MDLRVAMEYRILQNRILQYFLFKHLPPCSLGMIHSSGGQKLHSPLDEVEKGRCSEDVDDVNQAPSGKDTHAGTPSCSRSDCDASVEAVQNGLNERRSWLLTLL